MGSPCAENTSSSARKVEARALLLDEKGQIERPGRVIQRDDEIERRLALEPFVAREPSWRPIIPGSGRRSRLRLLSLSKGAPCAAPSPPPPPIEDAAWSRSSHEPKPWSFTGCSWKGLTVKPRQRSRAEPLHLLRPVGRDPPGASTPPLKRAGLPDRSCAPLNRSYRVPATNSLTFSCTKPKSALSCPVMKNSRSPRVPETAREGRPGRPRAAGFTTSAGLRGSGRLFLFFRP